MRTILILEDEPVLRWFLRRMLKQYSLIEAASAEEALQLFADRDRQIDLLLADVTLPKSSGVQVALLLRLEIPNLPIILTSGFPVGNWSDEDSADLAKLGSNFVEVLQKPFGAAVLSNAVFKLIGEPQPERVAGASET